MPRFSTLSARFARRQGRGSRAQSITCQANPSCLPGSGSCCPCLLCTQEPRLRSHQAVHRWQQCQAGGTAQTSHSTTGTKLGQSMARVLFCRGVSTGSRYQKTKEAACTSQLLVFLPTDSKEEYPDLPVPPRPRLPITQQVSHSKIRLTA